VEKAAHTEGLLQIERGVRPSRGHVDRIGGSLHAEERLRPRRLRGPSRRAPRSVARRSRRLSAAPIARANAHSFRPYSSAFHTGPW